MHSGKDARAVVAEAGEVVVASGGHRKGLATVHCCDPGKRPTVQRSSDSAIEAAEVVRLPDEG